MRVSLPATVYSNANENHFYLTFHNPIGVFSSDVLEIFEISIMNSIMNKLRYDGILKQKKKIVSVKKN